MVKNTPVKNIVTPRIKIFFWIIVALLALLVILASRNSRLFQGFTKGEFNLPADIVFSEIQTKNEGSLTEILVNVRLLNEPVQKDFFIIGAEAKNAETGGTVWRENLGVNTKDRKKHYVVKFLAPLPCAEYDITLRADITNEIKESDETNNTEVKHVVVECGA